MYESNSWGKEKKKRNSNLVKGRSRHKKRAEWIPPNLNIWFWKLFRFWRGGGEGERGCKNWVGNLKVLLFLQFFLSPFLLSKKGDCQKNVLLIDLYIRHNKKRLFKIKNSILSENSLFFSCLFVYEEASPADPIRIPPLIFLSSLSLRPTTPLHLCRYRRSRSCGWAYESR